MTAAAIDVATIARREGLALGKRFVHEKYTKAKSKLEQELVSAGYAHAKVAGEVLVDRRHRTAEVRYKVDLGPMVQFGNVLVDGNRRVPTPSIKHRVLIERGDRFDPEKLDRTSEQVRQLGTFSSVQLEYAKEGRPAVADVRVAVHERLRHEIKVGGGGALDGARADVHARFDYANWMTLGPLVTFRGSFRPGIVVYDPSALSVTNDDLIIAAQATLQREDLFLPLLAGSINVDLDRDVYEAYTTTGWGGGGRLERPFWARRLTLAAGYQWETLFQIAPVDGLDRADIGASSPYRLGYLTQSLTLDLRDDPLETRKGVFAQLAAEEGRKLLGGTLDFVRFTGDARGYLPLGRHIVIAAKARAGTLDSPAGDDEAFSRRFYAGGAASHRGFGFRRLAPFRIVNEDGTVKRIPVGGDVMVETGAEARIQAGSVSDLPVTWALFLDGGDVVEQRSQLSLSRLNWAAGAGARIASPVGPVRLDIAFRLNRTDVMEPDGTPNPDPGARFAFHLSVGEAF